MLFNSYEFILLFLPLFVAGWYVIARFFRVRACEWYLVAASCLFYARFGWKALSLLLVSALISYALSRQILKKAQGGKGVLLSGIALHLSVLFFYKTAGLLAPSRFGTIAIPVGLSFYSFQQIAYLIECYCRDESVTKEPVTLLDYLAYITYFPKLVEGPITLPSDVLPQLRAAGNGAERRAALTENLSKGLILFVIGLSKKVLLADRLAPAVDFAYLHPTQMNPLAVLVTMAAYLFQLYFDFSGYCDMALGVSAMIGIRLPQNFSSPIKAASIQELWQRWHITLTRFFTRYVYIPLGGSRRGALRRFCNTMLVFLLSSLWHGIGAGYLVWGALNGLMVALLPGSKGKNQKTQRRPLPRRAGQALTCLFFSFSIIFFRAPNLTEAWKLITGILPAGRGYGGLTRMAEQFRITELYILREAIYLKLPQLLSWYDVVLFLLFLSLCAFIITRRNALEIAEAGIPENGAGRFAAGLAVLFVLSLLSLGSVSTFLYFKF